MATGKDLFQVIVVMLNKLGINFLLQSKILPDPQEVYVLRYLSYARNVSVSACRLLPDYFLMSVTLVIITRDCYLINVVLR